MSLPANVQARCSDQTIFPAEIRYEQLTPWQKAVFLSDPSPEDILISSAIRSMTAYSAKACEEVPAPGQIRSLSPAGSPRLGRWTARRRSGKPSAAASLPGAVPVRTSRQNDRKRERSH